LAILFFPNLSIFTAVSSRHCSPPLYSFHPTFIHFPTVSTFFRLLFLLHFVRQQINFLHLNCNFKILFFTKYSCYIIADSCYKKKKMQRMEAPIEQLVNILIYYRERDLSTCYILLMLFSVLSIFIRQHSNS